MRVNPNSPKEIFVKKSLFVAFHGKSLAFTDSNKMFKLKCDLLDGMTTFHFDIESVDSVVNNRLLGFLDEMTFDVRRVGGNKGLGV